MKQITLQHPLAASTVGRADEQVPVRTYEWRQMLGFALIGIGILAVAIGWFGVSGEAEPWKQMPYLASGGIGGAAAIAVGVTCLISFEHASDRRVLIEVLGRLEIIESELDRVREHNERMVGSTRPLLSETNAVEEGATPVRRRAPRQAVAKT